MTVNAPAAPAATTTPAATPTTVTPAPASTPAPAPQSTGGFLDHVKLPESSPADSNQTPPTTPPAAVTEPGITPDPATPKAGETPTVVYKTTIRGREYTGEELRKAFEHSSAEGIRLDQTVKQVQQELAAERAARAELEEKANETPPFKILTKQEMKELDTVDLAEYISKRDKWEMQKETRKESLTKAKAAHEAETKAVKEHIYARSEQMMTNTAEYPGYKELMPVMAQILDRMPNLAGRRETPDLLYYAALGLQKYREGKVSKDAEQKAKDEAAAQAAAQAAAAGSGNPPAPVGSPNPQDDDSDEAFNKRLLAKAPKRIF